MNFNAIISLESELGNIVRAETISVNTDFKNDQVFLAIVEDFKKDASERTKKWQLDGYDDSCFVCLSAAEPDFNSKVAEIDNALL